MRNTVLPLQRIRVELERTLRARPFFARAIRGDLAAPPYARLIAGLSGLLESTSAELATDLSALAASDLEALGAGAREPACGVERHFAAAVRDYARCLQVSHAFDASLAILGTSWTVDAARRLRRRHPGAAAFLARLGADGPQGLSRLSLDIEGDAIDLQHIYGFAELSRGVLLGLAAHLDSTWPAPLVSAEFVVSRD